MKITYYWEDEKIKTTYRYPKDGEELPKEKKIVFTKNLIMWLYNHKEIEIGSQYFCRSSFVKEMVGEFAISKDGLCEYRQVEDIESKEELLKWSEVLETPLGRMKRSLTYLIWTWANRDSNQYFIQEGKKKNYTFKPYSKKQLYYDKQDLYVGFSNALFCGYSFNNCNPDKVYENVYYYDMSSFYAAIMYFMTFPAGFVADDPKNFLELKKNSSKYISYYGQFIINIPEENYNEFLEQYDGWYNRKAGKLVGWFNDIDIKFIQKLTGIDDSNIYCIELYKVFLQSLTDFKRGISVAYQCKEASPKGSYQKKAFKLVLEKLCGSFQRRKTYTSKAIWNPEKREFEKEKIKDKWENINERGRNFGRKFSTSDSYEYSTGVWIQSYARLILLEVKEAVGNDALYGDIDSIIFKNKENIEKIRNVVSKYFTLIKKGINLGSFKNEVGGERPCLKLKVLGKKWYAYSFKDESGNDDFVVKCSGAKPEIVKEYLKGFDNPIEMFSKTFPSNVRPYVKIKKANGIMEYCYTNWTDEEDIGRET